MMNGDDAAQVILGVGFLLTKLLESGYTWKQILDSVDGQVSDEMRAQIATEQAAWEADWRRKRTGA